MIIFKARDHVQLTSMLTCVATYLQSCLDQDTITVIRIKQLMTTLNNVKILAAKLDKLQLTDTEYAYLRLCILFKSSNKLPLFIFFIISVEC